MRVYIMGAGSMYKQYRHLFTNLEIIGIVDNSKDRIGDEMDGYTVFYPDEMKNLITIEKSDYIILCSIYYQEMREQLCLLGVPEARIIDIEHLGPFGGVSCSEQYIFNCSEEAKRVLMFSHSLDLTGAPILLCRLAVVLKELGYYVTVIGELNSNVNHKELLSILLENHISVIMVPCFKLVDIEEISKDYDFYWVSTILLSDIVRMLCKKNKNVYWWIHEADDVYRSRENQLKNLDFDNLFVLSGGWVAGESFNKNTGYSIYRDLPYGVPALERVDSKRNNSPILKVGMLAAYSERKGYDFLGDVIKKNLLKWNGEVLFVFGGRIPLTKQEEYKELEIVELKGELGRDEVPGFYDEIDVLVCPSFYDPMPVVVTEAMRHHKLIIVSDKVGQSKYVDNYNNGIVFTAGSSEELAEAINWVIAHREKIEEMGDAGYTVYENLFSMDRFIKDVKEILRDTNNNSEDT